VRNPFLTAKDNIALLFQKARKTASESPEKHQLSEASGSGSRRRFSHQRPSPVKGSTTKQKMAESVANLLEDFVRLHGLLFLKTE
jgi:hypothetical protein